MKTFKTIFANFFFALVFTAVLYPGDKSSAIPDEKRSVIIETLLQGLNSDNLGLKTSAAQMLGELNANEAVIPLMKMLHSDNDEEVRIVAALALYKIGNPLGIFAVKQAVKFDNSSRVRKLCSNFYNDYALNGVYSPVQVAAR